MHQFGRRLVAAVFVGIAAAAATPAAAQPHATLIAQGFDRPIAFIQNPSDPAVQVLVEQGGHVRVLKNGVVQPGDYLDLSSVVLAQGEQGLLGFAFAPDYATSGRVFASFIDHNGNSVVSRFTRSTTNTAVADPSSRFDFSWPGGQRYITQPFANHNGGNIAFGPDGYLYLGLGDGGSADDPFHNAQNPASLLGKMLRLNVSVSDGDAEGYDVPAGNPFAGNDGILDEIWAFGLRNPWRWSFDDPARGGTGALVIGDVGQNQWEEVDYEPAGSGGRNYGWRNREGAHAYVVDRPTFSTPLTEPIFEYSHADGHSITGGVVYRGQALGPAFYGRYFVADFAFGRIWSLGLSIDPENGEAVVSNIQEHTGSLGSASWSSFGVDAAGELYVLAYDGRLLRIDPGPLESGANLVANGTFASGMTGWLRFATPDISYIESNISAGGALRFRRVAPPSGSINQATVFHETGVGIAAGTPLTAAFDLGNTSGERKFVKVLLVGDRTFSDLAACTFWLAPNAPLRTYEMRAHTTKPWTNAAIYFYASSTDSDGGFYKLDNVSLHVTPGGSTERTDCIDPSAPAAPGGAAGPNLIANGDFDPVAATNGVLSLLAPWGLFGTITVREPIVGGVLEFIRSTGTPPSGVVLQATQQPMTKDQLLTLTLQLGNSSAVRKRALVLVHDQNFSDLAACTWWLAPGQALSTYAMKLYAGKAWTSATVSVYPATIGLDQWIRLDNVALRRTPAAATTGTTCLEGSDAAAVAPPPPPRGAGLSAEGFAGITAQGPGLGSGAASSAPPSDADPLKSPDGTWTKTSEGWTATATGTEPLVLRWTGPVDLTGASDARLTFESQLTTLDSRAEVQVSTDDGVTWLTVRRVTPTGTWQPVEIDLRGFLGEVIEVRFVLDASAPADPAAPDAWRVREVELR